MSLEILKCLHWRQYVLTYCPDLVADVVAAAIGWIHIRFLALLQRKAAAQRGLRQTHIAVLQEKKTSVKHDSPLKVVKKMWPAMR